MTSWFRLSLWRVRYAVLPLGGAAFLCTCGGDGTPTQPQPAPVAAVNVEPATASLRVDSGVAITARLTDANGNVLSGRAVVWALSDSTLATLTGQGVSASLTGRGIGTVSVLATSEGRSGSGTVTILPPPVATVAVSPTGGITSVETGDTLRLTAQPRDPGGHALSGRHITWFSATPSIATVDSMGLVRGIATGSDSVGATAEGKSGWVVVKVIPAIATLALTPSSPSVVSGATAAITATLEDSAGNVIVDRAVAWQSSDTAVATVAAGVPSTTATVRAGKPGAATLTATAGRRRASAVVTVVPGPANTVTVALADSSVAVGAKTQATAVVKDARGNLITDRPVAWSSAEVSMASVSSDGIVTATMAGRTAIVARVDGVSGSAPLAVTTSVRISFLRDSIVVLEYPSIWDVYSAPDPSTPWRQQGGSASWARFRDDLATAVQSDGYDFVLLYTADSVPGWINGGFRAFSQGVASNIGLGAGGSGTPPANWSRLRSMPDMNWPGFHDPATGMLAAFHEMAHQWLVALPPASGTGARDWHSGMPVSKLAGCCGHWSWNWLPDSTDGAFAAPGIMYSSPTDRKFNAFDLYAIGLLGYAEASRYRYWVYESPTGGVWDGDSTKLHPITLDSLIATLDYKVGDGRRMPDTDPAVQEIRVLTVLVKGQNQSLAASDEEALFERVRRMPDAWRVATWGRSTLRVDLLKR